MEHNANVLLFEFRMLTRENVTMFVVSCSALCVYVVAVTCP